MKKKFRIPRRLKKIIKNYLLNQKPHRSVYYMTKHYKAYAFTLHGDRFFTIYHD